MTKFLIEVEGAQGALMKWSRVFEASVLNASILSLSINFKGEKFSDIHGKVGGVDNHGERKYPLERGFNEDANLTSLLYGFFADSGSREKEMVKSMRRWNSLGVLHTQSRQERQEWDPAVLMPKPEAQPFRPLWLLPFSIPIHIYNGNVTATLIKPKLFWAS